MLRTPHQTAKAENIRCSQRNLTKRSQTLRTQEQLGGVQHHDIIDICFLACLAARCILHQPPVRRNHTTFLTAATTCHAGSGGAALIRRLVSVWIQSQLHASVNLPRGCQQTRRSRVGSTLLKARSGRAGGCPVPNMDCSCTARTRTSALRARMVSRLVTPGL